jgi:hypothetical protein
MVLHFLFLVSLSLSTFSYLRTVSTLLFSADLDVDSNIVNSTKVQTVRLFRSSSNKILWRANFITPVSFDAPVLTSLSQATGRSGSLYSALTGTTTPTSTMDIVTSIDVTLDASADIVLDGGRTVSSGNISTMIVLSVGHASGTLIGDFDGSTATTMIGVHTQYGVTLDATNDLQLVQEGVTTMIGKSAIASVLSYSSDLVRLLLVFCF